jgi:ABC-type xylose transport system permease subunit
MPDIVIYAAAANVAALMLIVAIRALTWHKVSPSLTGTLLLLVLFVAWQLLKRTGSVSLEQWVLFVLCALVGLVAGLARGQMAAMRYMPSEGDVLCRRGSLLIFGWAVVVLVKTTLLTIPGLRVPAWQDVLPPALIFLTAAFTVSTLTILARVSATRHEYLAHPEQEQVAQ